MAPATKPTAAELMDLITSRAPALIAAGVTELEIDGFAVKLSAPPPAATPVAKAAPVRQHVDPLQDPSTYAGGRVPGYTRDDDRGHE